MATESGEPSDINRVLAFIEGFHEGKTAMDEQCFQELGKAIVHYMDLQGEIDEAKDKYKRLTADVLKIVQQNEDDPEKRLDELELLLTGDCLSPIKGNSRNKRQLGELQARLEKTEEHNRTLQAEIKEKADKIRLLEQQNDKSESFSENLQHELEELLQENKKLEQKLQEAEKEKKARVTEIQEQLHEMMKKTNSQLDNEERARDTIEYRLKSEMEEKTQLVAKVEELSKLLKESEHRVQNLTIELGKKSQKATQAASSVHILQTQVDRMRLEAEEAHANFERELNNLYCKIKEKDNQIEKLKTEVPEKGDKDRDLGHTGITLTDDFSEGSMFGSYIADLGQNNSVRSEADLSPRSRSVNMEINVENIAPLEAFSKKPGDAVTDTQKPQLIDKCTMTKEIREDPLSPNNTKMADMCEKINTLTLKIEALDNEVAHYRKMETVYKNTIKERDQSIADYEARLLKNTEEYIITMNDLNNEFEHLSMKYNKLKKR